MNYDVQYYKGLPIVLIDRDYENYLAKRFHILGSNQNYWIPNSCLNKDASLREDVNYDFIFLRGRDALLKARYAGYYYINGKFQRGR